MLAFAFIMPLLCYINMNLLLILNITTMNKLTTISRNVICEAEASKSKKELNQVKQQFILIGLTLLVMFGTFALIIINS